MIDKTTIVDIEFKRIALLEIQLFKEGKSFQEISRIIEAQKVVEIISDKEYIISDKFNEKQLEAIQYNKKNNLIVSAGPGSGKTSVFVERIKYITKKLNVKSRNILGLTFTEKASNEFKERSDLKLEYLGTFHSVFFKLLQEYGNYFNFKILNEEKNEYYLKNNMNLPEFEKKEFTTKIGTAIKLDKFINEHLELVLECNTINEYYELLNDKLTVKTNYTDTNIIKIFFEKKIKNKKMSFSDIIIYTYLMIKSDAGIQERLIEHFSYVLVDEFQDTNKIVLEILNLISHNNLFLVGDIYQSIYSFQGSSFEKSLILLEDFDVIQLDINYRSSANIVDFSNKFIDTNMKEKSNKINAVKESGLVVNKNISVIENISDFTIPELIHRSGRELNEICVLARNNNHIKEIKEQFDKWKVPYKYKNEREFEYFLDAILLMFATGYELNDIYFNRFRLTGDYTAHNILDILRVIEIIMNKMNIVAYFSNRGFEEDLQEKFKKWSDKQLQVFSSDNNLNIYLETVENKLDYFLDNELYIEKNGVNIMTIHKSKGLEWNTVILYNQEDGIFPINREVEEEKRLYYVAITRAKENLIITSKHKINSYTSALINAGYIDKIFITKQKKYELDFASSHSDIIKFTNHNNLKIDFIHLDFAEYEKNYKSTRRADIIEDTIRSYNEHKQRNIVDNINAITIEDLEIMLLDLESFKQEHGIDNLDLKYAVENIDTERSLFFDKGKINSDYINNDFTDIVHKIINYRNWVNEENINDIWFEEKQIKIFKSIVKFVVSKKYTDLTKDRAKKYIQKRSENIYNKAKNSKLNSYQDFVNDMLNQYYTKSNEQKSFFTHNVLGMHNVITNLPMIDLTNNRYDKLKGSVLEDFSLDANGYSYNREILKGSFLNQNKTIQAQKRWAKLKYLEFAHSDKRAFFLTFTNKSIWHKWKTKHKSLKEDRKYGDSSILKDNENFVMQGNNLQEHFINSAKEINKIWTYFYQILKVDIQNYKKKNKLEEEFEVGFFRQLEAHKNLTSHGHILLFVDEVVKGVVKNSMYKTIQEFGLNGKFQDLQEIKNQSDVEPLSEEETAKLIEELMVLNGKLETQTNKKILKGIKTKIKNINKRMNNNFSMPSSYIGKYMLKNAFKNEEDDLLNSKTLEFFNAWESMIGNKVKITGMSNYKHTTQKHIDIMYGWFQENAPEAIRAVKRTGKPLYHWLEKQEIDGNFTFGYERQIKENFKNSDFIKDVELIFTMLKTNELTIKELQSRLEESNFNIKDIENDILQMKFREILKDRTESENFLWELATNFVLGNQEKSKYINIHTNKKLINAIVADKLICKYEKTAYVKGIEAYEEKINTPHISFAPREWSFKWTSFNGKWNLKSEVYFNTPNRKSLIYVEDMYIKGWITANEIVSTSEFDTYSFLKNRMDKIKHYDNYAPNVDEAMNNSFKEEIDIFELMRENRLIA